MIRTQLVNGKQTLDIIEPMAGAVTGLAIFVLSRSIFFHYRVETMCHIAKQHVHCIWTKMIYSLLVF